jgi:KUP system potassium uptake protein
MTPKDQTPPTSTQRTGAALVISALGVVFGDIGTSPLYTLNTVFGLTGGNPASSDVLGIVSLIFWTLVIIVAVKYVSFAMRMDNDGEGGIRTSLLLRENFAFVVSGPRSVPLFIRYNGQTP